MDLGVLVPGCDRPHQSLAAALGGGLVGGIAGLVLGFGPVGTAWLAGALGGLGDIGAHLIVRDPQFEDAMAAISSHFE